MVRYCLSFAVTLVILNVIAVAQPGVPADDGSAPMPPMQVEGMTPNGPVVIGGRIGQRASSIAAWDGYIYILQGSTLTKLSKDFTETKSVELPSLPGFDSQIAADAKGVYLLRAGLLTVYGHDLNQMGSTQIGEPRADMVVPRGMGPGPMLPGNISTMGFDMGPIGLVSSPESRIEGGTIFITSRWAYPREATVSVDLRNTAREPEKDVLSISAFLYPKGKPELGCRPPVDEKAGGCLISCTFAAPGEYELAIRIIRRGMPELTKYQHLSVH